MIVTTAAYNGVLGAVRFLRHFKGGPGVVIETPDHFRIQTVGEIEQIERRLDFHKVFPTRRAEKILKERCSGEDCGTGLNLAVKDAQRIRDKPAATIAAELLFLSSKKRVNGRPERRSALIAAERIDFEVQMRQFELF